MLCMYIFEQLLNVRENCSQMHVNDSVGSGSGLTGGGGDALCPSPEAAVSRWLLSAVAPLSVPRPN